jgi:hypothetical protein
MKWRNFSHVIMAPWYDSEPTTFSEKAHGFIYYLFKSKRVFTNNYVYIVYNPKYKLN